MIKINIQLFGGRGASSGANTSNKPSALEVFKESAKKLNEKISEQSTKIDEFCKENDLKRDNSMELVKEQIVPRKSVGTAGRNYPVRLQNGNYAKFA